jgi:hypothetical protein
MKRIVLLGACLAALGVLHATVAVGASAADLPEFSKLNDAFASTLGSSYLEVGKERISCTSGEGAGNVSGTVRTRLELIIRYKGCEDKALGTCTSTGEVPGVIVTSPLVGDLGYLKKESTEAGLDVSPQFALDPWMTFTCGTTNVVVGLVESSEKAVIGKITPVNTVTKKFTVDFKCIAGGKQEYRKLLNKKGVVERESELNAKVGGGSAVQACLNSTDALTFAESLEISA